MASSRVSLHECKLELRLPILSHTTATQTAEKIALHAAATPTLDHTEAYTGSTVFLLLSVTVPPGASDQTHLFLQHAGDPLVALLSAPTASRHTRAAEARLPVVRESKWQRVAKRANVVVKAVWVLLRAGADASMHTLVGRHDVVVTVRERVTSAAKNSPVWATIDRASRLFGKATVLRARRKVLVVMPVDVTSHVTQVAGSVDKPVVSLTVRNATADAHLSVAPPCVDFAASRRMSRRKAVTLVESHPAIDALHRFYEAVPLFPVDRCADGGVTGIEVGDGMKCMVQLGPREVFKFAFRIERRGDAAADKDCVVAVLSGHDMVQTGVTVMWRCARGTDVAVPNEGDAEGVSTHVAMGRGGDVLAAGGERALLAMLVATLEWQPMTLLHGVVVSLSGPVLMEVGRTVYIGITVFNRTERRLSGVTVAVQRRGMDAGDGDGDGGGGRNLLVLRSVVAVGAIEAGAETRVRIACRALRAGSVVLDGVSVGCKAEGGSGKRTWVSQSRFQGLAVVGADAAHGGDDGFDMSVLEALVVR